MKITAKRLKQIVREEVDQFRARRGMPDIRAAIEKYRDSWDLVEIINEIGALVAQNHYSMTYKYDMGSMDLAGDILTEFEEDLMPYIRDYFGEGADVSAQLGKIAGWLDEAIRNEIEEKDVF